MSEKKKLVVVVSNGFSDERSSVALSVANSGINSGLDVTMFLVSAAVDLVRKGAAAVAQLNPLDPTLGEMLDNFISAGGKVLVCPACAKVRGYGEKDVVDGVSIKSSELLRAVAVRIAQRASQPSTQFPGPPLAARLALGDRRAAGRRRMQADGGRDADRAACLILDAAEARLRRHAGADARGSTEHANR